MVRPLVLTVLLLFAVVMTTRSVDGSQEKSDTQQNDETQCRCKLIESRHWEHCERVIDIDQIIKAKKENRNPYSEPHDAEHISIRMQDSVLFVWTRPFTVVRFDPARTKEFPSGPHGLANPFFLELPAKATVGWESGEKKKYRLSTGPARGDQPPAVLKLLENEEKGISYNAILADENGKPIDPHIEITK